MPVGSDNAEKRRTIKNKSSPQRSFMVRKISDSTIYTKLPIIGLFVLLYFKNIFLVVRSVHGNTFIQRITFDRPSALLGFLWTQTSNKKVYYAYMISNIITFALLDDHVAKSFTSFITVHTLYINSDCSLHTVQCEVFFLFNVKCKVFIWHRWLFLLYLLFYMNLFELWLTFNRKIFCKTL